MAQIHRFITPTREFDIRADNETEAINLASRLSDDDLVSSEELDLYELQDEQPELFI